MKLQQDGIKSFIIGTSGIYFTYIYYGILQEKMFKTVYINDDGIQSEKFNRTCIFLFFQSLFSYLFSLIYKTFNRQPKNAIPTQIQLKMSFLCTLSLILGTQALLYVSFPLQSLIKSAKILSIFLTSITVGGKKFTLKQLFQPILITIGILLFDQDQKKSNDKESSLIGIGMILISLTCDGLLGLQQQKLREIKSEVKWEDLMESLSYYCALVTFFLAIVFGDFQYLITYVQQFPQFLNDLITLALCSMSGQLFIFYTIEKQGPYILSIITTTRFYISKNRKFFTVICSIILYGHQLSYNQIISLILVFLGVFIELFDGSKKQSKKKSQ